MRKFLIAVIVLMALSITACQDPKEPEMKEKEINEDAVETSAEDTPNIEVTLKGKNGIDLGVATLSQKSDGVEIAVEADHLPAGLHGFHIHEKGICETPSFESAGGHFNPYENEHGFESGDGPHLGDMKNLKVAEDGSVRQAIMNNHVTLEKGKKNSLFSEDGTSLIIHAEPDDYKSQPSGDAGERIICGVISKGKKK